MKKKTLISLFIISFATIVIGLIVALIGLSSGAMAELKTSHAPQVVERSFSGIKDLDLSSEYYGVNYEVTESPDDKVHVKAYHYQGRETDLIMNHQGASLTVGKRYNESFRLGILEFFGERLSDHEERLIEVALPKGMVLDRFTLGETFGGTVHLSNLHIKEAILNEYVVANQVTIDKGSLVGGEFTNSTLKNITTTWVHGHFYLTKSTLDHSDITFNNWFKIEESIIKNSSFKGPHASFVGKNITLDNSTVTIDKASIELDELTVLGQVELTTGYPAVTYGGPSSSYYDGDHYPQNMAPIMVKLASKSRETVNLDVTLEHSGSLSMVSAYKDVDKTEQTAKRDKKDVKDKLIIKTQHNDVHLD